MSESRASPFQPVGSFRLLRALRRRDAAVRNEASAVVLRAAALLRAGMPESRVWRVLGRETPESAVLAGITARIERGSPPAEALAAAGGPEWRMLAAAWGVAESSGAPIAPALERFAISLRSLDRLAERRKSLLAGPRATIRLVVALPPLALLLGAGLGFDPLPVLLSPVGVVLAAGGTVLLALGAAWARSQVRRVAAADRAAGWAFELAWIALGGGGPPGEALRCVADRADAARADWMRLSELREDGPVRECLRAAESLGSPAGPLLLGAAETARARTQAGLEQEAERLAVRVLVPLGVCVLPAFVLLGVVPVLMAVLGGAGL